METAPGPVIVLVKPQLGFNIGACARAMSNCGLRDLRLVDPRDGWPSEQARRAASGALSIIEEARVFSTTAEAVADLRLLFATTGRTRDLAKPVRGPVSAVEELREAEANGLATGVMFGPERTGLENEDLILATRIMRFPLHPDCRSLNLAQAVLLLGWEWWRSGLAMEELEGPADPTLPMEADSETKPIRRRRLSRRGAALEEPASAGEMLQVYEHLEQELDRSRFFRVPEKRAGMILNLRSFLSRTVPTRQEVKTLHGVITALSGYRKNGQAFRRPDVDETRED